MTSVKSIVYRKVRVARKVPLTRISIYSLRTAALDYRRESSVLTRLEAILLLNC